MSLLVNNNLKYVFSFPCKLFAFDNKIIDWNCDIITQQRRHILQNRMSSMNPERIWLTEDSSHPS